MQPEKLPWSEKVLIAGRGCCNNYFQWIVLGEIGDHGAHVQRLVVQVPSLVQGPKTDHYTEGINAQDHQPTRHHATSKTALVRKNVHC